MFDELNVIFSQEEIRRAIRQLRNGKSAGPDKPWSSISRLEKILQYIY